MNDPTVHTKIDYWLDEIIWKTALHGDNSQKVAMYRGMIHDAVREYFGAASDELRAALGGAPQDQDCDQRITEAVAAAWRRVGEWRDAQPIIAELWVEINALRSRLGSDELRAALKKIVEKWAAYETEAVLPRSAIAILDELRAALGPTP